MKKILFLIHTLGVGGAEKVLVDTANALATNNNVTVMTIIDTGAFREKLSEKVTYKSIFKLPFSKKKENNSGSLLTNKTSGTKKIAIKFYQLIWKIMPTKILYNLKVKDNYDVEIAFLEGITAKVLAPSKNKKMVWIHVDLMNEKKSDKVFWSLKSQKKCYNSYSKVICVSEVVKQKFIEKLDFDKSKVEVLYNPINQTDILKKSKEKIEKNFTEKGVPSLITVGRLAPQKGYDRLIRVLKKLSDENYKFKMNILGVGPDYEELKKLTDNLEMNDKIKFLGFSKNPFKYIVKSDFFVCSSIAEGFSTVVSEACILHVPTVTTDCSGMSELFLDNEYGYIVDNNETALYEGIKYFLDNPKVVKEYKKKLADLNDRFDLDKSILRVEEKINEVITD